MPRIIKVNKVTIISCPKCGNNSVFEIHSNQCGEDVCEVWAVCYECGYEPTKDGERFEDIYGGTNDYNCLMALSCWNESLISQNESYANQGKPKNSNRTFVREDSRDPGSK